MPDTLKGIGCLYSSVGLLYSNSMRRTRFFSSRERTYPVLSASKKRNNNQGSGLLGEPIYQTYKHNFITPQNQCVLTIMYYKDSIVMVLILILFTLLPRLSGA